MRDKYLIYVGTNSVRGSRGIYTVAADPKDWSLEVLSTAPAYNAGGICLSPDRKNLYAAAEGMTFDGFAAGGVAAFAVGENGKLTRIAGQPTGAQRTCCVASDEKQVYSCDFIGGVWNAFPRDDEGRIGPACLNVAPPEGSGWPAVHCIEPVLSYVAVMSLAECAVVLYRKDDGSRADIFPFKERVFPRYLVSRGEMLYAMLQTPGDIFVFHVDPATGKMDFLQRTSVLEPDYQGFVGTSTLRITPDGALLLAANRSTNSVTVFTIEADGTLTRNSVNVLHGEVPRDFHISGDGRFIAAAMQRTDELQLSLIDYENKKLVPVGQGIHIPSPAAVAIE